MFKDCLAVFLRIFVEKVLQLRVDRTLTAIIHDYYFKGLVEFVENNPIIFRKRIGTDSSTLKICLNVVPI